MTTTRPHSPTKSTQRYNSHPVTCQCAGTGRWFWMHPEFGHIDRYGACPGQAAV